MGRFHRAARSIDHLERLGHGSTVIHRLHVLSKFTITLLYIVLVVSVNQRDPARLAPFFLYPAVMMPLSDTPYRALLARLAVTLPFSLAAGISNILVMRESAFVVDGLSISWGMISCAVLLIKTMLCVFAVLIFMAATPFTETAALLTAPGILRITGLQIVLTYRYIATLLGEAEASWTAYMLRAPSAKAILLKDMGTFLGTLLLRSFDRAGRVYAAMKCRGFNGMFHAVHNSKLNTQDILFIAISGSALIAARFCWRF